MLWFEYPSSFVCPNPILSKGRTYKQVMVHNHLSCAIILLINIMNHGDAGSFLLILVREDTHPFIEGVFKGI